MSRSSKYGQADVGYIQQHQLAMHTDSLLSALLRIKPPDPLKYFQAVHKLLKRDFQADYALWLNQSTPKPASTPNVEREEAPEFRTGSANILQIDPSLPRVGVRLRAEGRDCVLYGADTMVPHFQEIIDATAAFDASFPAKCNGRTFSLQNEVHYRFRLASLFLHKIGRDSRVTDNVKSSKGHYEYPAQTAHECVQLPGLPNVKLTNIDELRPTYGRPLSTPSSEDIIISAKELDEMCLKLYGPKQTREMWDWPGWTSIYSDGVRLKKGIQVSSCTEIFGTEEFCLSRQEVRRLMETTKVYTGADLPSRFFLHLVGITSRDNLVEYYCNRKAIPLAWMATAHSDQQLCHVGQFVADLLADPLLQQEYGFRSTEHFKQTIQQSLTELSTQVCWAGQGYFFVGNHNQIQPKTHFPVTFLSAPGIDFNAGAAARTELNKYFLRDKFRKGGRIAFKERMKRTYHILFTACKDNGVTHPTAIAMGLGVFMPPIEEEEVKCIYHEAQFELLSEYEYGFDTYFLNPAKAMSTAKQLLAEKEYPLRCRVVIHNKDGKALASRLAHEGHRTSFLNPSDCIAVMQGCVGYWWECGMGERYVGEEDFCATSTAILKRSNICLLWSASDRGDTDAYIKRNRVVQVLLREEQMAAEKEERKFEKVNSHQQAYWQAYPMEQAEVPNRPKKGGYVHIYEVKDKPAHTTDGQTHPAVPGIPPTRMAFFRILWVDTDKHHRLHLRPMINQLREVGIVVDVAHTTEEAERLLMSSDVPINCVLTSLFVKMKPHQEDEVERIEDSGHLLLKTIHNLDCDQAYYFRTICASMTAINSHERSMLYSEGCNYVMFDLHTRHFQEVMESMCFIQRHSDRLCHAIASSSLDKQKKRVVVERLLQFGIDVNFPPKAWAPLHFLARDADMDPELMRLLLATNPKVEIGTRYTTDGISKGATPLQVAVECNNLPAVRMLMEAGASPFTCCQVPMALTDGSATPMSRAEKRAREPGDSIRQEILAELLQVTEQQRPPSQLPKPTWHSMLTILWISTSEQLSHYTYRIRRLINLSPSLVVQTLTCRPCGEDDESLEAWIENTLHPFMEDVGTEPNCRYPQPLAWLQCVVLELTDSRHLHRWLRLRHAIKERVKARRPDHKAPWLKVITYAEEFQVKPFDDLLAHHPYLVTEINVDGSGPRKEVILNSVTVKPKGKENEAIGKEVICESGRLPVPEEPADPRTPKCSAEMKRFYEEVCNAVTHWSWDGDDRNALYPDFPYDAQTSHLIEAAYRDGAPSCVVSPIHKLFFRDMVQRKVDDPMKLRLVFRYPRPCFDCDAQVRAFPSLLNEIASGNCLIFIGAGFCIPAGGPSWKELLQTIAELGVEHAKNPEKGALNRGYDMKTVANHVIQRNRSQAGEASLDAPPVRSVKEMTELRDEVERLVAKDNDHTQFELAAQLLEDALQGDMKEYLAQILKERVKRGREIIDARNMDGPHKNNELVMASRINYVQCLKFSAVLTTNYSQELCVCDEEWKEDKPKDVGCGICKGIAPLMDVEEPPYLDIIRKMPGEIIPMQQRPIIQIHGSVCKPHTIVLSREGYRTLLHGKPNYRDFLKSVMMSRTILYLGFSFTDDYLNEVRSDVMSMKKHSPDTKNLAYAIINDKSSAHCGYYDQHEGVKFLTWPTSEYGYGVMDRYLDSLLNMTDTSAALSGAKIILFSPPDDGTLHGSTNQNLMKLKVELDREKKMTQVFKVMPKYYYQDFQLISTETLSEVEQALKADDFLQSWVVIFADPEWDSIPMMHRELIHFLWHPHARLNTTVYPPTLLVWADEKQVDAKVDVQPDAAPRTCSALPLKEQYENNLHVQFCTSLPEVLAKFRRVNIAGADDGPREKGTVPSSSPVHR
eukprot:GGOE01001620.1.p1 GENE.GGOE01001620.1~~GGOE01001620.1.p1  ORF type:complete len:1871 (-),score=629.58 GGOE01001620.1:50-5662(-)